MPTRVYHKPAPSHITYRKNNLGGETPIIDMAGWLYEKSEEIDREIRASGGLNDYLGVDKRVTELIIRRNCIDIRLFDMLKKSGLL